MSGLSGIGIAASSIAAWQLTKKIDPITPHSIPDGFISEKQKLDEQTKKASEKCGEYIWGSSEEGKNNKNKNRSEWFECYKNIFPNDTSNLNFVVSEN